MTSTKEADRLEDANRILDSVRDAEESVLEAARKFVDTVNDIFPDVGDDAPRRKIIDSAFRMTEQLVGTSNEFARKLVKATSDATVKTDHETASRRSRR
jgi:hypothetical protein